MSIIVSPSDQDIIQEVDITKASRYSIQTKKARAVSISGSYLTGSLVGLSAITPNGGLMAAGAAAAGMVLRKASCTVVCRTATTLNNGQIQLSISKITTSLPSNTGNFPGALNSSNNSRLSLPGWAGIGGTILPTGGTPSSIVDTYSKLTEGPAIMAAGETRDYIFENLDVTMDSILIPGGIYNLYAIIWQVVNSSSNFGAGVLEFFMNMYFEEDI